MTDNEIPDYAAQAPARRIGAVIGAIAILIGCSCLIAIWAFFGRESLERLQTSWHLLSAGVTTMGTVVDLEERPGVRPNSPSSYVLFVEFEANGQTYTVKSLKAYPSRDSSWRGQTMPIIYDPADPTIAQIDTFDERWATPLLEILP